MYFRINDDTAVDYIGTRASVSMECDALVPALSPALFNWHEELDAQENDFESLELEFKEFMLQDMP